MTKLTNLITEKRNDNTTNIDNMSTMAILEAINSEDMTVAMSVQQALPQVGKTVDAVNRALERGGKLFYVGAGTSGRIGILDAVECPPTFSTPPDTVQAVMAGGIQAIEKAVEGAEDDEELAANDMRERNVTELDVVMGIAASGRTPYVIGALKYARELGATTVGLSNNEQAEISNHSDISIEVLTGPEALTGSTRLKAATAQKMVLNMVTTASMIKSGKIFENLMVDLKVSNKKLEERAKSIVTTITDATYEKATEILEATGYEVKPAIVMIKTGVNAEEANRMIFEANGFVRQAIEWTRKEEKNNDNV